MIQDQHTEQISVIVSKAIVELKFRDRIITNQMASTIGMLLPQNRENIFKIVLAQMQIVQFVLLDGDYRPLGIKTQIKLGRNSL